jgi:single-stranded DNA-specific DHH superfamily exonuclease
MLTETQLLEIRAHLEKAQNPLFYYDNDADGFCSFVLLRRFLGRGKGVAVRSFPDLNASYARKAQELNADYVFVLDKPVISKEFVEEVERLGLPMVWLDHHNLPIEEFEKDFKNLFVFNPSRNKGKDKSEEPTTYQSYKITNKKEDSWIAVIGCIADHHLPEFVSDFKNNYPDFWGNVKDPFEAYYKTEIGRIAQSINFGLKDSVTNVVRLQNFIIACKTPNDVFAESTHNAPFRKKYSEIKTKYRELLDKAKKSIFNKMIFFEYSGELSISADLSNELSFLYPNKHIVVAYKNGNIANLSLRGKNVKEILKKVLGNFEGASGGGHENAVGARMKAEDLAKFKELFSKEIEK